LVLAAFWFKAARACINCIQLCTLPMTLWVLSSATLFAAILLTSSFIICSCWARLIPVAEADGSETGGWLTGGGAKTGAGAWAMEETDAGMLGWIMEGADAEALDAPVVDDADTEVPDALDGAVEDAVMGALAEDMEEEEAPLDVLAWAAGGGAIMGALIWGSEYTSALSADPSDSDASLALPLFSLLSSFACCTCSAGAAGVTWGTGGETRTWFAGWAGRETRGVGIAGRVGLASLLPSYSITMLSASSWTINSAATAAPIAAQKKLHVRIPVIVFIRASCLL